MKRVIVEMKAATGLKMASLMEMDIAKLPGFSVDKSYLEVGTPSKEIQASLGKNEQVILIRGEIEEGKEEELKKQPNVINVWTDSRIEAFDEENFPEKEESTYEEPTEFGESEPGEENKGISCFNLGTGSPCPPTDCGSTTAKGTISDVAKYLGCDKLWAKNVKGQNIIVGIVDGGVDNTKVPVCIGGWTPDPNSPPGSAIGDHGTMCATDVVGMCPEAKIYDVGVLKSSGISGMLSDAITAYNWALTQYSNNKGPHILSNSWGIFQKSWAPDYAVNPNHPFTKKVEEVIQKGIIVTFAAGNCGQVCPSWKCSYDGVTSDVGPGKSIWGANGHPKVITVGAANIKSEWIGYSSQGPASLDPKKPDFCAPSHFKGYTLCDNGTSAATPICAGVIGLLKSKDKNLTQDKIKEALQKTALNLCTSGWDQHSGYGLIQAEAAYKYLFPEAGPYKIAHAMWTHGNNIHVEMPETILSERRCGFYTRFIGKPETKNWFHYAIPTPVIVDNKRLKIESVMIQFRTSNAVKVTSVHVYDGVKKIASHEGLSLSGLHWFERFDVKNMFVQYGLGISIGVSFGNEKSPSIDFSTAGADLIE